MGLLGCLFGSRSAPPAITKEESAEPEEELAEWEVESFRDQDKIWSPISKPSD